MIALVSTNTPAHEAQGVTGGSPSEPSSDAGVWKPGAASAGRISTKSEQAAQPTLWTPWIAKGWRRA